MDERDRDHLILPHGKGRSSDGKGSGCLRQGCLLTILIAVFIFIIIPLINNTGDESTDNGTSETGLTEPTDTTPTETVEPLPEQTEESGLPTVEETETGLPEDIQKAPSSEDFITRDYSWPYGGKEWTWELSINQSMYDYFKEVPRPPTMNYSVYVTNPQDDPYIDSLVEDINETATEENYSEYQIVEFAIAFVQNLPYTVDSATSPFDEYPRYPVETLVDNGGDCEDTSILLASILNSMGYGVILIEFPEHCAVGVKGSDNIYGTYWEYEGEKYFYIETTGSDWAIGELPDEYKETSANMYPMIPVPIIEQHWHLESKILWAELTVEVTNLGTATASDIYIIAGYDAGDGKIWNTERSEPFDLAAGYQANITLNLPLPPSDIHTRVVVQIGMDEYSISTSYSEWFDT